MVYPDIHSPKRTDEGFRNGSYGEHHKVTTPFIRLPINMIEAFPVGDSLHLLHLGVMKRFLFGWRDGTFRKPKKGCDYDRANEDRRYTISEARFTADSIDAISFFLTDLKLPREFQRATRGLQHLTHWKGTEYRTFLHYVGIVALKNHLVVDAYENFKLLFCAVTLCSAKRYFGHLHVARMMIDDFIEGYIELYGVHYVTSNVHNLCHLVDEVEMFGELQTFTAYPFENALGRLKRFVRSGNRPLAQVAKRLLEMAEVTDGNKIDFNTLGTPSTSSNVRPPTVSMRFGCENIPKHLLETTYTQNEKLGYYAEIKFSGFTLSAAKAEDSWFLTNSDSIGRLMNVIVDVDTNNVNVCYSEYSKTENFFTDPCDSKLLRIHSVRRNCDSVTKIADVNCIQCKLVCLKDEKDDSYVFVPLLHTQNL